MPYGPIRRGARGYRDRAPIEERTIEAARPPSLPEPRFGVIETVVSGAETNDMRVFRPDGDGSWPIVYGIPGSGGSGEGDLGTLARELARRGVLVFVTDWAAETDPEQALADAECGYRLARSVAASHGGTTSVPVTMLGFSLGATTALDLTLGQERFGPGGDFTRCSPGVPRPTVAVAIAGCHTELGFGSDVAAWGNAGASFVLASGSRDDVCAMRQSVEAGERLAEAGYAVSVFEIPDADHGDVVFRDTANGWVERPPDHLPGRYTVQLVLDAIAAI